MTKKKRQATSGKNMTQSKDLVAALFSSASLIIVAIIAYFGSVVPKKMEIEATENAKATETSFSLTQTARFNVDNMKTQEVNNVPMTSATNVVQNNEITPSPTFSLGASPTLQLTVTPSLTASPTRVGGGSGYIVFSARDDAGDFEIFLFDIYRKNPKLIQLTYNSVDDYDPTWSPAGDKIAFISTRDGKPDVFIMGSDGSNPQNITNSETSNYFPSWTLDDNKIVFASHTGNADIYKYNISVENEIRLTNNVGYDTEPSVSLDGSNKVVFRSNRDDVDYSALFIMNLDGSDERKLIKNRQKKWDTAPSFSPDGAKITFVSSQFGQTDIFIVNSNGENVQQITFTSSVNEYSPSWSPDGLWIVFVAESDGIQTLYRIRVDGSELIEIIALKDVNYPSWQP